DVRTDHDDLSLLALRRVDVVDVQRVVVHRQQAEEVVVPFGHGLRRPVLVNGPHLELLQVAAVGVGPGGFASSLIRLEGVVGHGFLRRRDGSLTPQSTKDADTNQPRLRLGGRRSRTATLSPLAASTTTSVVRLLGPPLRVKPAPPFAGTCSRRTQPAPLIVSASGLSPELMTIPRTLRPPRPTQKAASACWNSRRACV